MKPNNKAYEAARSAILKAIAERNCIIAGVPFNENNTDEFDAGEAVEHAKVAVDAAIAAVRPHIEAAERERCAAALEITSDEIRLHAGEMTAQEMRSVLAVLAWRAAAIRSGK